MPKPTSVQVSTETHAELTTAIMKYGLRTGKRITYNTLIIAALTVAMRYPAQLDTVIATGPQIGDIPDE